MLGLAIYREAVYSPGRDRQDAEILERSAAALADLGVPLACKHVDELSESMTPPRLVLSMVQGKRGLALLADWQTRGTRVVNATTAVRSCHRERTLAAFTAADLPYPPSVVVNTVDSPSQLWRWFRRHVRGRAGCPAESATAERWAPWIKRADLHATRPDDVRRVASAEELAAALAAFSARGLRRAVIQAHCVGRVVKFYGVGPGRFFDCPQLADETKGRLERLARRAAACVGLEVYGGDCVVAADGTLRLIDLNDWPSFWRCRSVAARAIAAHVARGARVTP